MSLPLLHAGRTNPGLSPKLDLRFALDKSLTAYRGPTPSFSRASTGSYFDGSGVLRYANVNVLLYSEQFENAYWDKTGNVTITSNQVTAHDGKLTADLLKPTASNATHYLYRSSLTYSAGSNTLSLFVKYQNHRWVVMQYYDGTISKEASFDLLNGVAGAIGSGASSSIISAGNGWYRISLTASTASSSSSGFYTVALNQSDSASIQSWSATGTESVAIWGAQLESGSTVGTYCPTTTAANSAPRFNHTFNGTSWVSKGLLVEEQRTNAFQWSEDFSNAFWTKASSSISANSIIAPDGILSADKLIENSANTTHYVVATSQTLNGTYTFSIFAKSAERGIVYLDMDDTGTGGTFLGGGYFDLVNGTATARNGATVSIFSVGNGWYRCSVTATGNATATPWIALSDQIYAGLPSYLGNGSSGIYIWGAQLELGSFPTSYIPTTSASVTRSADVCQITGSDFSGFWNGTEGSFAVECDRISFPSVTSFAFEAYSDISNKILLENDSTADYSSVRNGGVDVVSWSISPAIQPNISNKSALAYKANDFAWSKMGATPVTDTSGGVPYCNALAIGNRGAYGALYALNGHIARLRYFNKRLPNATLQLLSDPDPTLNLQFALNKTLTPVAGPAPSFSRASTGTYFNASGVLTSASINTPRFDHVYSGGQWVSRGLLIEEQRTNLIIQSNLQSTWTTGNATLASTTETTSPDGTNNARKLTEDTTATTYHYTELYPQSPQVYSGYTYTASVFVKANGRTRFYIASGTSRINLTTSFNLSNGTVVSSSGSSSSITNVGNGWYRCTATQTASSTGATGFQLVLEDDSGNPSYTGDGTKGVFVFGYQVEEGAFATSLIPTTTSSVVRSADVCQITGTSFNWMWNQGEGSFLSEVYPIGSGTIVNQGIVTGNDGTFANVVGQIRNVNNLVGDYGAFVRTGNSTQVIISRPAGSMPAFASSRAAFGYKLNDFADSLNGVAPITDTVGTVPTVNRLTIGDFHTGSSTILNGCISQIIYYPARLTNTKLQQLST